MLLGREEHTMPTDWSRVKGQGSRVKGQGSRGGGRAWVNLDLSVKSPLEGLLYL